jgi:hypothetical protein
MLQQLLGLTSLAVHLSFQAVVRTSLYYTGNASVFAYSNSAEQGNVALETMVLVCTS